MVKRTTSLAQDPSILEAWRQPETLTVSQWADRHRWLEERFSPEPGRWNSGRAPYQIEWMDSANKPWVGWLTICAGTQVGKSEAVNNIVGYFIHQDPTPMMFVVAKRDDARLAAERRLMPMIRASDALRGELSGERHDTKRTEISFKRSILYLRGAQVPADLAGVPVGRAFGDELDKWPTWTGREANPLSLMSERTKNFPGSQVIVCSTPTTRDGLIWNQYEKGDQRQYWVRCVHCREWLLFTWRQVKWDGPDIDAAAASAHYECQHCHGKISDHQKRDMVESGMWVPAVSTPAAWPGLRDSERSVHRSYHLWAAYSPWVTWGRMVREFLNSKDRPDLLMNFFNAWLAEPWEDLVERTTPSVIVACTDKDRKMFEVPAEVLVMTAAIDVQRDRLEWSVHGWGVDEETWMIACGKCSTWDEISDVLRMSWGKQALRISCAFLDSRYRRDEAVDFARLWPNLRLIAGVERDDPIPFGTKILDRHPKTGAPMKATQVWTVNVHLFKDLAAMRLAKAETDPLHRAGRIHLPGNMPEDFGKQLLSEHKIRVRSGAHVRDRWVLRQGHQRNEGWDLLVYNVACARMMRLETMRSPDHPMAAPPAQQSAPVRPPPRPRPRRRF